MSRLVLAVAIVLLFTRESDGRLLIPCWIRCHRPPKIIAPTKPDQIHDRLRSKANPHLGLVARSFGILTTYLGKTWGIQGWHDYHIAAEVDGIVQQAIGSTDGLYTVDIRLLGMSVENIAIRLPDERYIRIEVFPLARRRSPIPLRPGEEICVTGKLMWDGDGFFEVHPRSGKDLTIGRCN